MLTPDTYQALARELHQAEKSRTQVEHFSKRYPAMEMADSYAIQRAWVQIKRDEGRKILGHKIGLTSRAMQISSQITEPDYGAMTDDMLFPEGADIPVQRFILPRVEVELAFILGKPLRGPNVTIFEVLAATDYVVPALEIIDARIEQLDRVTKAPRKVLDTIADNAANAGIVTGGRAVRPDQIDMRWMGAIVSRNAEVEETGLGAGVLNQPARGVAWLANRLAQYGDGIEAGQIVLAGSFIRPVEARHGDTIVGDFGPYGSVSLFFA